MKQFISAALCIILLSGCSSPQMDSAVIELQSQIENLKTENQALEKRLDKLEKSFEEFSSRERKSSTENDSQAKPKNDSSSSTGSSNNKKTKKCAECGKPIYDDEVWCDDCLFSALGIK